ncbi:hypothetical protein D030_1515A, partial [Vibrio parahaemolyticus AQ3810]
MGEVD